MAPPDRPVRQRDRITPLIGVLALVSCLAGCQESATVTLHEPGQYQGKTDPLLATASAAGHHERLNERLEMIQTDR